MVFSLYILVSVFRCLWGFCVCFFLVLFVEKSEGQKRHRVGRDGEIWEGLGAVEGKESCDQNILYG